jgi:hypothetical protein
VARSNRACDILLGIFVTPAVRSIAINTAGLTGIVR